MEYISKNIKQTINFAKKMAQSFKGGEILLLSGELGAGKTAFTKGIAQGLQVNGIITSPTFTIMNMYTSGKLNLYHFDMYRIEDEQEIYELGFNEFIGNSNGVSCVEWFSQTPQLFAGKKCKLVKIEKIDDDTRKIIVEDINEYTNN